MVYWYKIQEQIHNINEQKCKPTNIKKNKYRPQPFSSNPAPSPQGPLLATVTTDPHRDPLLGMRATQSARFRLRRADVKGPRSPTLARCRGLTSVLLLSGGSWGSADTETLFPAGWGKGHQDRMSGLRLSFRSREQRRPGDRYSPRSLEETVFPGSGGKGYR